MSFSIRNLSIAAAIRKPWSGQMTSGLLAVQVSIVLLTCFLLHRQYSRNKARPGLPPGPRPLPIIGNLMDLPAKGEVEFQHWLKHKDSYGPISSVTVMGQTLIIINDKQAAHDLLETNSKKTLARPELEFSSRLCGFGGIIAFQQYDENFRLGRKILHQQLGTTAAVSEFSDIQEAEVRRFLLRMLNTPQDLIKNLRAWTGGMILKMTYGYSVEPNKADPLVGLIERMMANLSLAGVPLAWLVDTIPALKHLPDGFPGTAFKETARRWNKINYEVAEVPYSFVRQQVANRSHRPSYVSKLTQRSGDGDTESKLSLNEYAIKWTAASMYARGADTMVSTLGYFVLVMVMFPEVQRKAQEEIDRVIGIDRLPRLEDREKMPYIEGVVKEAYRWSPVAPLGVWHAAEEDIVYNGYLIPKGACLLSGVWWFCHDPEVYQEPDTFDPERYLEPRNEPDPKAVIFGFGRRICPGHKAIDEQGQEIDVKQEVTPGMINVPKVFPYKMVPRSAKAAELVRAIEVEQPWEKSDSGLLGDTLPEGVSKSTGNLKNQGRGH
ncbi:hypothetical protein HIM_05282 [Hirsutella minnesotensis 3608]|uniref:O-methylsterigmatocystin oxidoreductase n=1 Tax=Hirsutella minnesotensis 3608 TaxID=1043627 RepID=A0A0F7ZKL2_9HYPO|nr:hypothetical protein HIM_05282 [Hirsutella minnesotensis 3608]